MTDATVRRSRSMTTSRETDGLDHPTLRRLVDEADALPLADRRALLKGLIPGVARDMSPIEFEAFVLDSGSRASASTTRRCTLGRGAPTDTCSGSATSRGAEWAELPAPRSPQQREGAEDCPEACRLGHVGEAVLANEPG